MGGGGVKEGLRPFYSAFYGFVTLIVHQYTEHQKLDLESAGYRHERPIPVAERSMAPVCGHSTAGIKGSNPAELKDGITMNINDIR